MKLRTTATITPRGIARAAWVAIAASIAAYFSWHLWMLLSPPFLVLVPKNDIMTHDGFITLSGDTQKESHVFVNGAEIAVNKDGTFEDRIALADGINAIEVKSINKFNKATTVLRRIIKQ